MPLKITLGNSAEEELPTQATISLQIKKTLAGNILVDIIFDRFHGRL